MKKIFVSLLSLALFFPTLNLSGQTRVDWTLTLGASIPIGSYSAMSYNSSTLATDCALYDSGDEGGASVGFGLDVEGFVPIAGNRLSVGMLAGAMYSSINGDAKAYMVDMGNYWAQTTGQQLADAGEHVVSSVCNVTKNPGYFNIPIMAELKYTQPLGGEISLFVQTGAGLNIRRISSGKIDEEVKYFFADYSEDTWLKTEWTILYETCVTFAFRAGLGINLTKHLSLSAYYYNLGKGRVLPKISAVSSAEYVRPTTSTQSVRMKGYVTPSMVVAKLGYTF